MEDLGLARQNFLNQLHSLQPDLSTHTEFIGYWRDIQQKARHTEDLGMLDRWAKEIGRDRDKIQELKARRQTAASSQMGAQESVQLLTKLLFLLDDIGLTIRKRLALIRDTLGMWVFLAGPGKKSKPKPVTEETKADKDKESVNPALLEKSKPQDKDATKKAEQEKKKQKPSKTLAR